MKEIQFTNPDLKKKMFDDLTTLYNQIEDQEKPFEEYRRKLRDQEALMNQVRSVSSKSSEFVHTVDQNSKFVKKNAVERKNLFVKAVEDA